MSYDPKNPSTRYDEADYRAFAGSSLTASLVSPNLRFDSVEDASVFFARELDYIKSKTYDKVYPQFTALTLFPHTSEIDPGAETATYYAYDKTGMAAIISNYATDLPRADVHGEPTTVVIKSVGASYGYSVQEMRASRMAGKSLDVRKADAARYAIERTMNRIAWAGDAKNKLVGVLSPSNDIPIYVIPAGASGSTKFVDKTADEILADINGMVGYVSDLTMDVEKPDSIVFPTDVFLDLTSRRIPDTETTILKFLRENSAYIKNFSSAAELNAKNTETNPYAAAVDGQGVCLLYTKDADKLCIEDPMAFLQYPAQEKGLEIVVNCEARTAGAMIYFPLSAVIAPGVS